MLEAQGCRVLTAESGLRGLAIFGRVAVDLVVLDYRMPGGMDGGAVAREIKRTQPFVPVILLTAYHDLPQELFILANKSLSKGEDPIVLLTTIEELLESTSLSLAKPMHYESILDDAVHIMRSDFASIQMLFPRRRNGELRLLDFRGFKPEAARFWEWVRADSKSTCGLALRDRNRVVAPDIATCDLMTGSEDRQVYLQSGIRACQTTPLIARCGEVVGMISTHWRSPHQPSDDDFRLFDVLASQAAGVVEKCRREAS
jgi:CheY-like chemotaxis protein